ncbi:MAG: hypothetical protein MK171_00215 [Pirellulales bacterium]|nr:hypothetical protein [Pirellulales bacterium]
MFAEKITSRHNSRVKGAAKLRRRRQREKQGRILIDGAREVLRALDAGITCVDAFVCSKYCTSEDARAALTRLSEAQSEVAPVTPEVWEKLRFGDRDDGVVAVAQTPQRRIDQMRLPPRPLVAVLERLEKPGNVGAILRTADGAGIDGVILADPQTDLFNPNTIRASLGTVFSLNVCTATAEETVARLHQLQLTVVAAQPDATQLYSAVDFRGGAAIVLGSEAKGLSASWQSKEVVRAGLPMEGIADSLNVSAAAAVLFYEARRQRNL